MICRGPGSFLFVGCYVRPGRAVRCVAPSVLGGHRPTAAVPTSRLTATVGRNNKQDQGCFKHLKFDTW